MTARFALAKRLNVRGVVAGSMIAGYGAVAATISPADYVAQVVAGVRFDPNLTKQLAKGFVVSNLIEDYADDDRTLNWAAAIRWDNPEYRPFAVMPAVPLSRAPRQEVRTA